MSQPDNEQKQQYIAIWTKAVDTQMHFNEMSVKSRQLGLTFVAAALGLGIVLLSRHEDYSFPIAVGWLKFQINIALLLLVGAALALKAVRQLDLNVYHKMLRGAVAFGEDFEENHMKQIFDLDKGMTQAISHFSRYSDARAEAPSGTSKYIYSGSTKLTAGDKIGEFYKNANRFLWVATLVLFVITNVGYWKAAYGQAPEHNGIPVTQAPAANPAPSRAADSQQQSHTTDGLNPRRAGAADTRNDSGMTGAGFNKVPATAPASELKEKRSQ